MNLSYWLLKTEPETYSFQQFILDQKTPWNGVRNFQARNFLKQMTVGDLALIYHSGTEKSVVGIAKVVRAAYPDPDLKKAGEWVQVDLEVVQPLQNPVTLGQIKSEPQLSQLLLLKQSRLSVMPVSQFEFNLIQKMGGKGI